MSHEFLITFDGDRWLVYLFNNICWASAIYQSPMLGARNTAVNKTDKVHAGMILYFREEDTQINLHKPI